MKNLLKTITIISLLFIGTASAAECQKGMSFNEIGSAFEIFNAKILVSPYIINKIDVLANNDKKTKSAIIIENFSQINGFYIYTFNEKNCFITSIKVKGKTILKIILNKIIIMMLGTQT